MRTREEIRDDIEQRGETASGVQYRTGVPVDNLILEVLLDIRDLLNNKPL